MESFFGPIVDSYTLEDSLNDGFHIDLSKTKAWVDHKFRYPVVTTKNLYNKYLTTPESLNNRDDQSLDWRVYDTFTMLKFAIQMNHGAQQLQFTVGYAMDPKTVKDIVVRSVVEPGVNMEPTIILYLPEDD